MVTTTLGYELPDTKVVRFCYLMQSYGHVPLKVTLLIMTHHMTVRSCDPESIQYAHTTKTVTFTPLLRGVLHHSPSQ